jgi:hypothetical protein
MEYIRIPSTSSKLDGFGEMHSVLYQIREFDATFTLYSDSSDGEPISTGGTLEADRDEYYALHDERLLLTVLDVFLDVDELPSTTIPLQFQGDMKSYYDPWEPKLETLEESILGDDRILELGDEGVFYYEMGWWDVPYQWVAERGKKISGYDTIFINVTADLGSEEFSLPFEQWFYFANQVSVPVVNYFCSNNSWEDENEIFSYIIENTFTLQVNGFTAGSEPIPWGSCSAEHWPTTHKSSALELDYWSNNYMPKSGTDFEESSFDFGTEEVINWLEVNHPSDGLEDFLVEYPDAIVTSARYNASKEETDPEDASGEFWWNLTFGHKRFDDEEYGQYIYQVLVLRTTTWERDGLDIVHTHEYQLFEDYGLRNGSSPFTSDDLSSQAITMASSEQIFKTEEMVIDAFYTGVGGIERDELDWGDGEETTYHLQTSGWEQAGMDLIATLTGIETVSSVEYYWELSQEDLMQGGTLSSASIDAQTGRLVSIMEVEGTALQNAFKRD